jgi:hypothetical protein
MGNKGHQAKNATSALVSDSFPPRDLPLAAPMVSLVGTARESGNKTNYVGSSMGRTISPPTKGTISNIRTGLDPETEGDSA